MDTQQDRDPRGDRGQLLLDCAGAGSPWARSRSATIRRSASLDGAALSRAVDRAIAGAFVTVKPARRTLGSTTLKVENRLPFTVTRLVVRAGVLFGFTAGRLRGRRRRPGPVGASADPGGDRVARRTRRDQRPLIDAAAKTGLRNSVHRSRVVSRADQTIVRRAPLRRHYGRSAPTLFLRFASLSNSPRDR